MAKKKQEERVIKIEVIGEATKISATGFSLIEMLGILRMYEQRISLELLNKTK